MTGKRRLTKSLNTLDAIKQNNIIEFPGLLGCQFKGQTLVEVPKRDGYVYVRLRGDPNEVIQAYNGQVSPVYGLPVIVIRDATFSRYIIKGRNLGQYSNWGTSSYLPRHGAQHSFPDDSWGSDIVWVYDRQFMPLLISPTSGSVGSGYVYINPDVYYWNDVWIYAGAINSPNLLPYKPTNDTAKLVVIYLDISGSVQVIAGATFDVANITTPQIIPYLPALPVDAAIPLGAVRLLSGTTAISWGEIYDLRPIVAGNDYPAPYLIQDEGVTRTRRSYLNFIGGTVWAIDNAGDDSTDIIISGTTAGAAASYAHQTILTFVGDLTVADNPLHLYNELGSNQTISKVFLSVATAPTDCSIIVDVHKNGVTIFTNQAHRPTILDSGLFGYTTDIDVPAWDEDDYLTAHIDQIGSGTAGSDLVVHIVHND